MAIQLQVSNEEFLERLTRLFESSSKAHSVFVSHKRIAIGAEASSAGSGTHTIVVRATDGKGKAAAGRTKFTTHVAPSKLSAFQDAYSSILRTSTAAYLRKRDKAKERKADKLLKEKRKKLDESAAKVKPTSIGSKRGSGRRKRQQAQKKATQVRRERRRAHAAAGKQGVGGGIGATLPAAPTS